MCKFESLDWDDSSWQLPPITRAEQKKMTDGLNLLPKRPKQRRMENASARVMFAAWFLAALLTITSFVPSATAVPVAYTDEAAFLSDLSSLGYPIAHEGFEGAAWDGVRSTISGGFLVSNSITNLGLTWTSNFPAGEITTSNGAARTGDWGVFSYPHGSYATGGTSCDTPGVCGDGVQGSAVAGTLYAIGGWFRTNTPYAKVGLSVGTNVDFGETCDVNGQNCVDNAILGTAYEFFGVIDTAGFASFEYRELEGTTSDQKYIFGDDFYFAGTNIATSAVPIPATLPLFISGTGLLGFMGWRRKMRIAKAAAASSQ
jgi:hypothetical protein